MEGWYNQQTHKTGVVSTTSTDEQNRAQELEQIMKDPRLTDAARQQKTNAMRKSEVNFIRFLRTSERPQNYATLKIIGKGAFGEVKLVQRKHDGKVYALKALIKAEMVSGASSHIFHLVLIICSSRRINWLTFVLSEISSQTLTVPGLSKCTHPSKTRPFSTC